MKDSQGCLLTSLQCNVQETEHHKLHESCLDGAYYA